MSTQNPAPGLRSQRGTERAAARQASATGGAAPAPQKKALTASELNAIQIDGRKRVMAAYTIAKTLLPQSDSAIQAKFAAALIEAPTSLVTAAFKNLAALAYKAKQAAEIEGITKTELNVFIEKPELLNSLKAEVEAELKGEAKTAKAKQAAPGDPGEEEGAAPAPEGAAPGEGEIPGADAPEGEDLGADPAASTDAPPADPGAGAPPAPAVEPAADAGLMGQIEQVEQDVSKLEDEASRIEDQALDLAGVFDPAIQADKANSLANEGDAVEDDSLFGPSDLGEMENNMATFGSNPQDFFADASHTAGLQLDAYLGNKTASDGVVDDMASEFATSLPSDPRDAESDHDEDILSAALDSITQEEMKQKRDQAPSPEAPTPVQAAARRSNVQVGQPALPKQAGVHGISVADLDAMLFVHDR